MPAKPPLTRPAVLSRLPGLALFLAAYALPETRGRVLTADT